jgi:hypothetical protein
MKTAKRRTRWSLCILLANTPATTGCWMMSSYQSARMTEPGPARHTFAASRIDITREHDDNSSGGGIFAFDMKIRKCLVPNGADLGFNTAVFTSAGGGALISLGLEPRIALVNGILAIGIPMNYIVGTPLPYGTQWAPGMVVTVPVSDAIEINLAARMMFLHGADNAVPIYNFGLGFTGDRGESFIRPEIGVMPAMYGDSDEWFYQVGIGFEPRAN